MLQVEGASLLLLLLSPLALLLLHCFKCRREGVLGHPPLLILRHGGNLEKCAGEMPLTPCRPHPIAKVYLSLHRIGVLPPSFKLDLGGDVTEANC